MRTSTYVLGKILPSKQTKNATLPKIKGEVAVAVPPLFVALHVCKTTLFACNGANPCGGTFIEKMPFPIADINKLHQMHLLCGIFTVVRSLQKQFALAFCLAVIVQIIHQLLLFGKQITTKLAQLYINIQNRQMLPLCSRLLCNTFREKQIV